MRSRLIALALSGLIAALPVAAAAQEAAAGAATETTAPAAKEGRLFISLTTDDTWAAAKAIMFAHQKSLKNGHDTAIWLNVRGVYLADKKRPSHIHGLMAEKGTSIQDMLAAFMADGGKVIMCQACSAAAGLTKDDYIDGVEMGSFPVLESWLFAPDVNTLSW